MKNDKKYQKEYRSTHKEQRKRWLKTPKGREYCASCKEYMKSYSKEYYVIHKEEKDAYQKEHPPIYTEHKKSYQKEYYIAHKERDKERQQKWLKTPEGKACVARKSHKRRELMNRALADLTAEQWIEIQISQDYGCAICGEVKPLTRDHIIPVSKGGSFTKSNIQGLCRNCNSRKGNR